MVTQMQDGTVEFRFFRPNAECVTLTGDFNGWHQTSLPMTREPDGYWRYQLRLAPGRYQFRYLGDGQWYTDYAAFGIEHGPFGVNSVLKVDHPEDASPPPSGLPVVELPPTHAQKAHLLTRLAAAVARRCRERNSGALTATASRESAQAGLWLRPVVSVD